MSERYPYPWSVTTPDGQVISGHFEGNRPMSLTELGQAIAEEPADEESSSEGMH